MRERGDWSVFARGEPNNAEWWKAHPDVQTVYALRCYPGFELYYVIRYKDGTAGIQKRSMKTPEVFLPTRRAALKLCRTMNALIDSEK